MLFYYMGLTTRIFCTNMEEEGLVLLPSGFP